MPILVDMKPILEYWKEYQRGDESLSVSQVNLGDFPSEPAKRVGISEELTELVFDSLQRLFINVANRHCPNFRFNDDVKMDIITECFYKLHKPHVDFSASTPWAMERRAYNFMYTVSRNFLENNIRRKPKLINSSDMGHPDSHDDFVSQASKLNAFVEEANSIEAFDITMKELFLRAQLFLFTEPSLGEALENTRSLSASLARIAALQNLRYKKVVSIL